MAIALGVLVVTAAVTAGLARRSEVDERASRRCSTSAEVVGPEFDTLIEQLPAARAAAEHRGRSSAAPPHPSPGQHHAAGVERRGRRHRRRRSRSRRASRRCSAAPASSPTAPDRRDRRRPRHPGTARRRDAERSRRRHRVRGPAAHAGRRHHARGRARRGGRTTGPSAATASRCSARPRSALGVAALVAAYLARRMTRPLAAMETTARSIARGDLTGAGRHRPTCPTTSSPSLADAINAMAERARRRARARARVPAERVARPPHAAHVDPRLRRGDRRRHGRRHGRAASAPPTSSRRSRAGSSGSSPTCSTSPGSTRTSSRCTPRRSTRARWSRDAVEAFGPAAADLGVALARRRRATPVPATLDPQRLAQIVANLVENALKYATTRVDGRTSRTVGDRVEMHVDDDGPGIAPDDLPHVFERLYTSRTRAGPHRRHRHRPRHRARARAGDGRRRARRARSTPSGDPLRRHAAPSCTTSTDAGGVGRRPSAARPRDGGSTSRRT